MTTEEPSATHEAGNPRPDFICIGAQKAGTSWLHRELDAHPALWLPVGKELHYLDRLWGQRLSRHLFRRTKVGIAARRRFRSALIDRDASTWRLVFGRRTVANYGRLFAPAGELLSGEVTPAYAHVDDAVVEELAAGVPNCKIIFVLRDPVDRAAAHLRMYSTRDASAVPEWGEVPSERRDRMLRKSHYCDDIDRWEQAFGADQVFVGFFDDLRADPASFLQSVLRFLGVDAEPSTLTRDVAEVERAGRPEPVSDATTQLLAIELIDEVERLHERYDTEVTRRWVERSRQLAGVR